jgi:hypothetical protein
MEQKFKDWNKKAKGYKIVSSIKYFLLLAYFYLTIVIMGALLIYIFILLHPLVDLAVNLYQNNSEKINNFFYEKIM